jgi:superfamily II DNA/RNA helicase
LLTTDKISEGFNLNRAGMVINYDIPWNPVRVIQRVGRIKRISKKVFDKLYIVNFFPTEKGSDWFIQEKLQHKKCS